MNCPDCKMQLKCGCNSCKESKTSKEGAFMLWTKEGDTDFCPECGVLYHPDEWLDIEVNQLKAKGLWPVPELKVEPIKP